MWPAVATGLGLAAGWMGQSSANAANRREAKLNREFQRNMSNTAYTRATKDMRRVGLNPALMYGSGGPASSPSGSVAASQESVTAPGVSNALQVRMHDQQMQLLREQTSAARAQAIKTRHEATIAARDSEDRTARWSYYFTNTGEAKPPLMELLRAEHGAKMANSARAVSEFELAKLSVPERRAMAELFNRVGEGGKGVQMLLPLLTTLLRR